MPPTRFRLAPLPVIDPPARLNAANPTVGNVPEAFRAISTVGDPIGIHDGNQFPLYTYTPLEVRGVNEPENHFHGVQRLRSGNHVVFSGGILTGGRRAHVFVAKLGSRAARGPWGSNLVTGATPPKRDAVVACYGLDTFRWRAGGMSLAGDILAVPLEGKGRSRVVFLNAKTPDSLQRFKVQIDRSSFTNAKAAALTRLSDGRFICAVWREVRGRHPGRLDFHISKSDNFAKGFLPRPLTWPCESVGDEERNPKYQNINFVIEQRSSGATQLYLVCTENASRKAPHENGPNIADLWRVDLPDAVVPGGPTGKVPGMSHVATSEFHGLRDFCNFDAGAGLHIAPDGSLHLYACYHWRVDNFLRASEFASHRPGVIHKLEDAWVELYEHDEFRGKRLNLYGERQSSIPDYSKIFVEGGDFDDTVSSVRFQIPEGHAYRLYRDSHYKEEKRWRKAFVDLKGTGSVVSVSDLKDGPFRFGDRVSSSRYVLSG